MTRLHSILAQLPADLGADALCGAILIGFLSLLIFGPLRTSRETADKDATIKALKEANSDLTASVRALIPQGETMLKLLEEIRRSSVR